MYFCLSRRAMPLSAKVPRRTLSGVSQDLETFRSQLQATGIDKIIKSQRVAVACSGGPDSMALAALWREHLKNTANDLHAFIVDHKIRENSTAEAETVQNRLSGLGYQAHVLTCNWGPEMQKHANAKMLTMTRDQRYKLIAEACEAHQIGVLLLAHHFDDQLETFYYRLGKNSGLGGLAGMRAITKAVPIVEPNNVKMARPFLHVRKADLVATCRAMQIPFVEDPSNENLIFHRNAIRRVLADMDEAATEFVAKSGSNSNQSPEKQEIDKSRSNDDHGTTEISSLYPNHSNEKSEISKPRHPDSHEQIETNPTYLSAISRPSIEKLLDFLNRHRDLMDTSSTNLFQRHAMFDPDMGVAFLALGRDSSSWFRQRHFAINLLARLITWTSPSPVHLRYARVLAVYNDICAHIKGEATFRSTSIMRSLVIPPSSRKAPAERGDGVWSICREPLTKSSAFECEIEPGKPLIWDGRFKIAAHISSPNPEGIHQRMLEHVLAKEASPLNSAHSSSGLGQKLKISSGRLHIRPLQQEDIHFIQKSRRPLTTQAHHLALRHFLKTIPVMSRNTIPCVAWEGITSDHEMIKTLVSIPTLGIDLRSETIQVKAENIKRLEIGDAEEMQ